MVTRLTLGSSGHASMNGYFRDNSSFRALKAEPPSCFTDLEPHFEPRIATLRHPECDPVIALAANLCRRLAFTRTQRRCCPATAHTGGRPGAFAGPSYVQRIRR